MTPGYPGVLIPEHRLALDAARPGYTTLVSHGHGDHVPYDPAEAMGTWKPSLADIWCTPETEDIIRTRYSDTPRPHLRSVPYGEPFEVNGCRITFRSAGHILGSALIHVECPEGSVLYTGDFKAHEALTCPSMDPAPADVLITETTFGLPIFLWEEPEALRNQIVDFAKEALEDGATPVFLAYGLGKGQEVVKTLGEGGIDVALHGAVRSMCDVYERHGYTFPRATPYEKETLEGKALVCPPGSRTNPMVTKLKSYRTAYVSGWASLANRRQQMDADGLIALSDHADYKGLIDLVEAVSPRKVFTVHGYTEPFAEVLRKRGLDAEPLMKEESRGEE
ncbi:MAG TPA: MBL fold metallo-hydrolase [Candidatus Thermoplasmatota archaeon]|nr:MBL fold metallo-hydrolase [Candidatus Thermoplasmatota archaeon]